MRREDVVQFFGSQRAVAKVLGITEQAVSQWPEIVPLGRQYALQVLTGGRLQAVPEPKKRKPKAPERRVS